MLEGWSGWATFVAHPELYLLKVSWGTSNVNIDEIQLFLKGTDAASEEKRLRIVKAIGMYSVGLFAVNTLA